jgi:N-acetylglutamate synthase-like GNAT family acetyltransferase
MKRVEIRPARLSDFLQLVGAAPDYRVRAWAAERDGELLGVGGLALLPDETWAAFVHAAPGAHRFKVSFHRAGLMVMAEARRLGLRRVVATAETKVPRATEWLERLGFRPTEAAGVVVWVWTSEGSAG